MALFTPEKNEHDTQDTLSGLRLDCSDRHGRSQRERAFQGAETSPDYQAVALHSFRFAVVGLKPSISRS